MKLGVAEWLSMVLWITVINAKQDWKCPNRVGNCNCFSISVNPSGKSSTFKIICGDSDYTKNVEIDVSIYYETNEIVIKCDKDTSPMTSTYELLPVGNVSHVSKLSFEDCSLPDVSFGTIIHKMGITEVSKLTFESYKNLNKTLTLLHVEALKNVMSLDLSNNGLSHLPDNIFEQMTKLTFLNLKDNNLQLTNNMLKTLMKLKELYLSNNNLTTLPGGIFNNMSSLEKLNLISNKMEEIVPGAFNDLSNLKILELAYNDLQTLPPKIFDTLPNLKILSIHHNNFKKLPDDLFINNKVLLSVILGSNKGPLSELPVQFLANLMHMEKVDINKIQLKVVSKNLFRNSTALKDISLKQNKIYDIPINIFTDQKNLESLDLSYNKIESLPNRIFDNITKLKTLNLDHNLITYIDSALLRPLRCLQSLSVNNNQLKKINSNVFTSVESLTSLTPTSNQVEANLPFAELKVLKYLDLSYNNINTVYFDWMHSSQLDKSHNSNNVISLTDFAFSNKSLTINLKFNNITNIIFSAEQDENNVKVETSFITKVLLGNNPINCDCHLTEYLNYLKYQEDLQEKYISEKYRRSILKHHWHSIKFKIEVEDLKCENPLHLRGKLVTKLKLEELICEAPKGCPKKCACNTNGCKAYIVKCSEIIDSSNIIIPTGMEYTELHLEGNKISSFSELNLNSYNNNVTRLYLQNNEFTGLPISNKIEVLDISNNQLRVVEEDVVRILKSSRLHIFSLSGNPLSCKCKNKQFISFLMDNVGKITNYSSLNCSETRSINSLIPNSLCPTKLDSALCWIMLAVVVLVIGLGITLAKYEHEIKVYLYNVRWIHIFLAQENIYKYTVHDVVIFCADEDLMYVNDELIPNLEKRVSSLQVCLPQFDWIGGGDIHSEIVTCIQQSKRTVIVLSPSFLDSEWGMVMFKEADIFAIRKRHARLIVILNCDISALDNLDKVVQAYKRMNAFLNREDHLFWNKMWNELLNPPSFNEYFLVFFSCLRRIFIWFWDKLLRAIMICSGLCCRALKKSSPEGILP